MTVVHSESARDTQLGAPPPPPQRRLLWVNHVAVALVLFLRRLTRLEPPYIVAMVAIFAIASLYYGITVRTLAPRLAASLAYVHNLVYGTGSPVIIVAWSLEVEVLPVVLIVSTMFFVLIERPCMRKDWPQRLVAFLRAGWPSRERSLVPQSVRSNSAVR